MVRWSDVKVRCIQICTLCIGLHAGVVGIVGIRYSGYSGIVGIVGIWYSGHSGYSGYSGPGAVGELQGKSRLSPESAESSTQWDPYLVLIFKLVHTLSLEWH